MWSGKAYQRNIGFPNGPVVRYGNFFIPRVKKSSKISPSSSRLKMISSWVMCKWDFFSLKLVQWKMLLGRIRPSKSSYVFIIFLFLFVGSSPTQGDIFLWNLILNGLFFIYFNTFLMIEFNICRTLFIF